MLPIMQLDNVAHSLQYIPTLIDHRVLTEPDTTYASIPCTDDVLDGYRDITYRQISASINKMARWLTSIVSSNDDDSQPTLVYNGPYDLRWMVFSMAVQKCGFQYLNLNPNNTPEADIGLMQKFNCHHVIAELGSRSRFDSIRSAMENLKFFDIASLEHWLNIDNVESVLYNPPATDEEAFKTGWEISHSSGTTGLAKAMPYTVGYQVQQSRLQRAHQMSIYEEAPMISYFTNKRFLMPFPMTWGAGMHLITDLAIIWRMVPVLLPPSTPQPVSASALCETIKAADVNAIVCLPIHLQEIVKKPELLQILKEKKLEIIGYAGAVLDEDVGNTISAFTSLQPIFGNTEVGNIAILPSGITDHKDWQYVGFSPNHGCLMEPYPDSSIYSEEQLYELVLRRSADPHGLIYKFLNEPECDVYHTRDLFTRHPDPAKKYLWRPAGRTDDLNKTSNLSKFHGSAKVEPAIEKHPDVTGAFMGGAGDDKPFLIVEFSDGLANLSEQDLIERIWPVVEAVNKELVEEVKIVRTRIIAIGGGKKGFERLGKGTINRRAIPKAFEKEIGALGGYHRSHQSVDVEKT